MTVCSCMGLPHMHIVMQNFLSVDCNPNVKKMLLLLSVCSENRFYIEPKSPTFSMVGCSLSWLGRVMIHWIWEWSLLSNTDEWKCSADLPRSTKDPEILKKSGLRLDIIFHSSLSKQLIFTKVSHLKEE